MYKTWFIHGLAITAFSLDMDEQPALYLRHALIPTSCNLSGFLCPTVDAAWWRHQMETFPRYWPFVRRIHRSPVNFPTKVSDAELWCFSLICAWTSGWVNNRDAGDFLVGGMAQIRCHGDLNSRLVCHNVRRRRRATPYFFSTSWYLIQVT